jgi:tetratricopeptide (TPR) repeat protein
MIWPVNLAIFYPLHTPIAWQLIAESAAVLAGISYLVWRERKRSPWLTVGWLWFLATLLPVIGLVQVGSQSMADRYSYFPLIGIFLAITFSTQALAGHFSSFKKWLTVAAVLILCACVLLTEKQLRYWRDSESLFTHALAVQDSEIAHISLGSAFQDQNRLSEAMTQYIMAWRLNPESYLGNGNIARILDAEGKPGLAAVYYLRAAQRNPQSPSVYKNLGIVLMKLGRFDDALKTFSDAARLDPSSGEPHFFMGRALLQLGRDAEAVAQLRTAIQLEPDDGQMLIFATSLLAADENPKVRNGAEARKLADKIVKLTGGQQPAALDTLAMACAENGQFAEAVQAEQKAIKLSETAGQKDDIAVMQKRLQLYEQHQPWRESFKKN